jgi:hypothetical protein
MRLARIVVNGVERSYLAEDQAAAIQWIENSGMRPSLGDEFIGIFNENQDERVATHKSGGSLKEYGPSQGKEMIHSLVEAAKEVRREELILTNQDAQMLEDMGVETPAKVPGDMKCARCGVPFRDDIWFLILPDGRTVCEGICTPGLVK